jgi:hypothetical protein
MGLTRARKGVNTGLIRITKGVSTSLIRVTKGVIRVTKGISTGLTRMREFQNICQRCKSMVYNFCTIELPGL